MPFDDFFTEFYLPDPGGNDSSNHSDAEIDEPTDNQFGTEGRPDSSSCFHEASPLQIAINIHRLQNYVPFGWKVLLQTERNIIALAIPAAGLVFPQQASESRASVSIITLGWIVSDQVSDCTRARVRTHTLTHRPTHGHKHECTHARKRTHARVHARMLIKTYTGTHTHTSPRAPPRAHGYTGT
jgi:hypothetical protein